MDSNSIAVLSAGTTPVQILLLVCVGGLFVWGIISIVRWLIRIKTSHLDSLPKDLKEIKDQLQQNAITLNTMEGKLWSDERIKSELNSCIEHHQNGCPAWRYHCALLSGNIEKKQMEVK